MRSWSYGGVSVDESGLGVLRFCAVRSAHASHIEHSGIVLQGSMLDKHKLALQLSMRKTGSAVNGKAPKANPEKQSTKLVVRNVAFEATRQEVMSLFSPFGHMKSCRLPRKFDGTPR